MQAEIKRAYGGKTGVMRACSLCVLPCYLICMKYVAGKKAGANLFSELSDNGHAEQQYKYQRVNKLPCLHFVTK